MNNNENKPKTKIVGILTRIIFKNEDNGYHVLSVDIPNLEDTKITLLQPNLYEGVTYEFHGEWTVNPKFGNQFKAERAFEVQPSSKEGLRAYLQSSFFPGIGPVIANRIVQHFGENVIDIINSNPDKLLQVNGVSKSKLVAIKAAWEENKEINEIMMFLQQYGISSLYATKIYEKYKKNCITQVLNNPYKLANDISGIGFVFADKIALQIGFSADSNERVKACISYVLEQGILDGHCFLYYNQIKTRCAELLQVDIAEKISSLLQTLENNKEIKSWNLPKEEKRYYSRKLFYNETYCAEKVNALKEIDYKLKIDESLLHSKNDSIQLSQEQLLAVKGVLGHGISILTGGPGCGKCLKKGTLVLMYDGSKKKVEDILVGDLLMGDDSKPRKVLSLARGKEKMYDVISNDGKEWGCNESHILSLKYNDKSRNIIINNLKYSYGDIIDISVKDYLSLSKRKKHHLKQYSTSIDYISKDLSIPPYLLGLWLGDGASDNSRITNTDKEIFEYGESIAESLGLKYNKNLPKNRCENFNLSGKRGHAFSTLLREHNLIKNKHIPNIYKINSIENRLELLAGLLDSDGHYRSGNFEITLVNESLSHEIYDLALSLGFRVSINNKKATLNRKDGSKYTTKAYRVIIGGFLNIIPTKVLRKKANNTPNKNPMHSGFKLIDKGFGDYYGFEIDGNHRFVLGNYVVTHNTTTTKKIVNMLLDIGKKIVLAAPTGRASQRMTEVIGVEASTIHRLLSWDPVNGGFLKNEMNTIEADFIIIDESSMIDINLAYALLAATAYNTQILFIGDADQLEPVGPGSFFKDLISSGVIPVYRLNVIFRQGKESMIIKYAHEINKGIVPNIDSPLINPTIWSDGTDCSFIDSGFPEGNKDRRDYPSWSSLRYGFEVTQMIVKLYTEIMPKYIGNEKEIQILIPMNVGDMGSIRINSIIQNSVNPQQTGKSEIKLKEKLFRTNDKVIQIKNNYDLGVFNGDIGKIIDIDEPNMKLIVRFSENREVVYTKTDIFELDLAYAISIHKSQGSEFDCVILPIMMQHYRMLERSIIYTGLTRAKKYAVFIGQRQSLEIAVETKETKIRQTSLKYMLHDAEFANPMI